LIWLGLIGMVDPPRQGVEHVIADFHQAGIDTVMITGDQSPTAYAIGKALNLSRGEQLEILDSTHLSNIDPEVMTALASRVHVFARVSPSHKLQIVQALQRAGKVVAMTGDGINDGPALKAADIGIAMGHTGTDVAREVADVVLEDDALETMIIAVSHGRTIYNNIRKSVHFLLATNLSEIMVMFTGLTLGLGQPLNAMQLLWINLLSDIAPGLALALEPPEPDVLRQPPRNPAEPIFRPADFKRIAFESAVLSAGALGAYGYGLLRYGMGAQANTLAFMSLTMGQLLHAISCRSDTHSLFDAQPLPANPSLTLAVGGSLVLQLLAIMVPGLRSLLGLTPLTLLDSVVVGQSAVLPLVVNELTKKHTRGQQL
jgi:Ca2+-transporting ATPase